MTADHGESLGDHGETTHGLFAYDATLRVPLIVSAPGLRLAESSYRAAACGHPAHHPRSGRRIARHDSTGDRSARASRAATVGPVRPIYFEALDANLTRGWAPLRGVVSTDVEVHRSAGARALSTSTSDPAEHTNLVGREPERVRDATEPAARSGEPPPIARGAAAWTRQPRRDCGRSDTSRVRAARARSTPLADDPKRLVALSEAVQRRARRLQPRAGRRAPRKVLEGPRRSAGLSGRASQRGDRAHRCGPRRPPRCACCATRRPPIRTRRHG